MLKPKATSTREVVSLDGLWRFAIDTAVGAEPWRGPLDTPLEAPVPASYNDLFTDPAIRDHVGWVWYQRTVRVPRGWAGERIFVRVDAATHTGRVYVDDVLVTEHVGGYTPFDADITDAVSAGDEFRLTIAVGNELTNTTIPPGRITVAEDGRRQQKYLHDFYNYAGLARSVSLHCAPAVRVGDVTVVTDIEGTTGLVDYSVVTTEPADVRVRLLDAGGTEVATSPGARGMLRVPGAKLWQPGKAYLYELVTEVLDGDTVIDSYPLAVGIRTVEIRGTQLLINGEPFYLTGFGKHEDTAVRGKGHDNAYLVHDFELMRWTGANSFRTTHYPYAEEVLDLADRQGFVVIDESAAVGLNLFIEGGIANPDKRPTFSPETMSVETRQAHARELRELIARDKNHPSVVMWCVSNEPASNEDGSREYFEPLVELVRELDPTRPVTYASFMFASPANDRIADLFDVLCLNRYHGWYLANGDLTTAEAALEAEIADWVKTHGKPIVMSEYGADTISGLHSVWDIPWTEEYQKSLLEIHHRVFDRFDAVVGEQVWNFADFRTSNGIHRVDGNKKGVFTRQRQPKAAAHTLRARWRRNGSRKPTA
ncbi:beta-glucuronidase [Streptomyces sp. NL15-2K]|uniref:beta-glucuronidase n=1 Tax=Streptomyces sp. NL15-2K TaxID=376149 RepID=UPI000F563047|nr:MULTISPECIES: beta-glucuronidase [Actinomycetes]WKX15451.1 beta-glucuronidase [Kutzneria buriramensis]GCB52636.1 beta-glucuronidase [Streptomyces sp. NL15-2K]